MVPPVVATARPASAHARARTQLPFAVPAQRSLVNQFLPCGKAAAPRCIKTHRPARCETGLGCHRGDAIGGMP
eukprot:gene11284-biopygen307